MNEEKTKNMGMDHGASIDNRDSGICDRTSPVLFICT